MVLLHDLQSFGMFMRVGRSFVPSDLRAVQRGGKGFYFGRTSVYKFTSARQKQNETMQQYYSAMKDA